MADRIIAMRGGKIAGIDRPAVLLQDENTAERFGVPLDPHRDASEDPPDASVAETAPPGDPQGPPEMEKDGANATADGSRKKADFTIYKYYLANAGYTVVLCYAAAVVVWIFCTEFASKSNRLPSIGVSARLTLSQAIWINWWSEANTTQANRDVGFYIGIYAMLGVLGTIGAASAAW